MDLGPPTNIAAAIREWFATGGWVVFGGPDRTRTDGLCDANAALSQLSYGPAGILPAGPNLAPSDRCRTRMRHLARPVGRRAIGGVARLPPCKHSSSV